MFGFRNELRRQLDGHAVPLFWAAITLVLSLSGPLGTDENCSFAHRMLFWSVVLGGIILTNAVLCAAMGRFCRRFGARCHLMLVSGCVALLAVTPVSALAEGRIVHDGPVLSASTAETLTFLFLISMGITGYNLITRVVPDGAPADAVAPPDRGDNPRLPRLLLRVDPALRGDLLSITGRDHYVDIRTTAGLQTILMRFSDAMTEAAPTDGGQVHRSHWVAWQAVTGTERAAGKLVLTLTDGSRVPVSRTFRGAVAARGLLRPGD